MSSATPWIVTAAEVQETVDIGTAVASARQAFLALADGTVRSPAPWHLDADGGAVHVKGAVVDELPTFAVKASSGFPGNTTRGLPTSDGHTTVFDAETGTVLALVLDGGYLTELRTGAAGAVVLDLLTPAQLDTIAFIGTGGQIRHQIAGALHVRTPERITLIGRTRERTDRLAGWVRDRYDIHVDVRELSDASIDAAAIITATTATSPVLRPHQVRPGAHITAVGSDGPGKRELDPDLVLRADVIAVDDLDQSRRLGELQDITEHQLTAVARRGNRLGTIGDLLRTGAPAWHDTRVSVADLTGTGAQDATIAHHLIQRLQDGAAPNRRSKAPSAR
ncbi:ornithine cyclodeaminase family protein [Promicromonospora sukumoe]|uniref:ornithine cyclodeaminase family protein n=1 Tax=Promicromonospora sukumoe TaxID=88382 RepID=UPI000370B2DA|nr:ornithine cyclodeaminase family protein [Promicromonospora sukumoe]